MNDAVGKDAPRHLCIESRRFSTRNPWTRKKVIKARKQKNNIPDEYIVICERCEDYGISYTALKRARERGRIEGTYIDGKLCMKKADIEAYIRSPRKRGRPSQKENI